MTNHLNEFSKLFDGDQRYAGDPRPVADATPAPAPVRISPEVRETILRVLRAHCDSECRWASAVSPHSDGYKAAWARVDDMESAIAFVEALP